MQSADLVSSNPEILGGMLVFTGTRVPVRNIWDYLEGGHTIDEFLDDFPSVSRQHALAVLEKAKYTLMNQVTDAHTAG